MKPPWLAICVVAVAFLRLTSANSNEPGKNPIPATGSIRGKEPGELRDDNGLKLKLVWCPPGKFKMGSPLSEKRGVAGEDEVEVTLTNGFWLGQTEVTQEQWVNAMKTEPWKGERFTKEGADFPATFVDWHDAVAFCRSLTAHERLASRLSNDWEYTLPTEAQWERACRAGTDTMFSFGDDESKLSEYAWILDNARNRGEQYAHRVGQKKANPWGLFDMHGNVWEWCRDAHEVKRPGGRDPEVQPDEKTAAWSRVRRGGGWFERAADCRSAIRDRFSPSVRFYNMGFRVALIPSGSK